MIYSGRMCIAYGRRESRKAYWSKEHSCWDGNLLPSTGNKSMITLYSLQSSFFLDWLRKAFQIVLYVSCKIISPRSYVRFLYLFRMIIWIALVIPRQLVRWAKFRRYMTFDFFNHLHAKSFPPEYSPRRKKMKRKKKRQSELWIKCNSFIW